MKLVGQRRDHQDKGHGQRQQQEHGRPLTEAQPQAQPGRRRQKQIDDSSGFTVGQIQVTWTQVIALAAGVVLTVATGAFLRFTKLGTAMRAMANDRDITATLGVPVRRVEAAAWLGCGALAGIAGLLLADLVALDATTLTFLVISSLAAVLIARLRSITVTFVAAIVIGLLHDLLTPIASLTSYRDMTPFVIAAVGAARAVPAPGHDAVPRGGLVPATLERASPARARPRLSRPQLIRAAVIAALLLFVLFGLPQLMSLYYIDTMTQVAVYSMVAVGLGVLVGRVGLVSLGQVAVLAIGAWVAARLLFATTQPYPLILLEAGLITMVVGVVIGLPALRLRGLYLALITLMLAGGITVVLATVNFPNGGHGFLGYNGSLVHIPPIRRPSIAASDPAYFRYSVVVAILMFALVLAHIKTRPGRAWAAIRQSEPAALAAGINIWFYKLWAFALASFITGVAGGVLAGAVHYLYSIGFPTQDSITLLAVVLMGGVYSLWGAVVAALLYQFLPALLNNWGVSADWLTILFGIGVLQVLTTAPAGLADQVPKDLARLGRLLARLVRRPAPSGAGAADGAVNGGDGA